MQDYDYYQPDDYKNKKQETSEKLLMLCTSLKTVLMRDSDSNNEYYERAFYLLLEIFKRTNDKRVQYLPSLHGGLCRIFNEIFSLSGSMPLKRVEMFWTLLTTKMSEDPVNGPLLVSRLNIWSAMID